MALSPDEKQTIKNAIEIIERETANDGDAFTLRNFGTFKRNTRNARTARNPQTGDPIAVPAKSVLRFAPSKATQREL